MREEDQLFLPKEHLAFPKEETFDKSLPASQNSSQHQNHLSTNEYQDVVTLLAWHAPGRPFQKRSKEYFVNSLLIFLCLEVILFLFGEYLLMLVVLSLLFIVYALSVVPPHDFYYRISTEGIMVEDHFFLWQELYDFYFKKEHGVDVLHIQTKAYLPGELSLTLGALHKDQVKSVLLSFLPYREYVKPSFTEKSGEWLSRTFPLETKR